MAEDCIRSEPGNAGQRRSYLLFCLRSGNAMTNFVSEGEAWDELRAWARDDGLDSIEDLALSRVQDGGITLIAMDDALVRRVARELSSETIGSESRR